MALDVVQVEGCYMSSSLPKALYIATPFKSHHQQQEKPPNVLYFKAKTKDFKPGIPATLEDLHLPATGREDVPIQTDLYLEELCDVVDEVDVACETDPLLDRPPSPLFVPAKSGTDAETQIYPGELFDFDYEVEPILEALVGQTIEQAVVEIMAEEELALLIDKQKDFESRRNVELAEVKRLEEQEKRIVAEKKRRLKEQEEAIQLQDEVAQKIAACIFSQNYLSELIPQVYKKLETQGFFEIPEPETEMEEDFWPWLIDEVDNEIATIEASYALLDSLIGDVVQNIAQTPIIPITPDEPHEKDDDLLKEESKDENVDLDVISSQESDADDDV